MNNDNMIYENDSFIKHNNILMKCILSICIVFGVFLFSFGVANADDGVSNSVSLHLVSFSRATRVLRFSSSFDVAYSDFYKYDFYINDVYVVIDGYDVYDDSSCKLSLNSSFLSIFDSLVADSDVIISWRLKNFYTDDFLSDFDGYVMLTPIFEFSDYNSYFHSSFTAPYYSIPVDLNYYDFYINGVQCDYHDLYFTTGYDTYNININADYYNANIDFFNGLLKLKKFVFSWKCKNNIESGIDYFSPILIKNESYARYFEFAGSVPSNLPKSFSNYDIYIGDILVNVIDVKFYDGYYLLMLDKDSYNSVKSLLVVGDSVKISWKYRSGPLLDTVTNSIHVVLNWGGSLIGSLFYKSGALYALLPLFAIGISITGLFFSIKFICHLIRGK